MESLIDDVALLERIAELSERGDDPTGNWIGGGRPRTNHDGPVGSAGTLAKNFARWSAIHYAFYEELVLMDPEQDGYAVDLGCAGGARTLQLAETYASVLGIDRSQKAIDFARAHNGTSDNVTYLRGDWPGANLYKPDRIFAVEVFEHFHPTQQTGAISAAIDALVPGGLLFMTMPNEPPQPPPHQGTLLDEGFDEMIGRLRCSVVYRGHFDNDAPGDPCDDGWRSIGPKQSHHYAVLSR